MERGNVLTARKRLCVRSCVWKYLIIPAQGHSQHSPWSLGTEVPLPGSSQSSPETSCPLVMVQSLAKGSQFLNGSLSTGPGDAR